LRHHIQRWHVVLDLNPGILAHDPFHDQHLVALRDRRHIELHIVMKAERATSKGEEGIGCLKRRQLAKLRADDLAVAEVEPAVELLLATLALDKDRAGLLAEIKQLNDVGERKIA